MIMIQTGGFMWMLYSSLLRNERVKVLVLSYSGNAWFLARKCISSVVCGNSEDPGGVKCTSERNSVFCTMRELFELSEEETKKMMSKASLFNINPSNIVKNAKCLKQHGLNKENLLAHSWVLGYNSRLFPSALNHLKSFHQDVNVSLPFLEIPYLKLTQLSKSASDEIKVMSEKSKIIWLSELLECNEHDLVKRLIKNHEILKLPCDRILNVLNILKGGGVAPEHIVKDIVILKHNSELMVKRLVQTHEKGVTGVKPWCLRCEEPVFQRFLERRVKAKEFLGEHKSVKEYLMTRLQCSEETLSYISGKIPQVKHISVLKVKELLDYLYEVGYWPNEVLEVPRILTRSRRTVKIRVEELQALGLEHPGLLVLCKTAREYKEFIKKMRDSR